MTYVLHSCLFCSFYDQHDASVVYGCQPIREVRWVQRDTWLIIRVTCTIWGRGLCGAKSQRLRRIRCRAQPGLSPVPQRTGKLAPPHAFLLDHRTSCTVSGNLRICYENHGSFVSDSPNLFWGPSGSVTGLAGVRSEPGPRTHLTSLISSYCDRLTLPWLKVLRGESLWLIRYFLKTFVYIHLPHPLGMWNLRKHSPWRSFMKFVDGSHVTPSH